MSKVHAWIAKRRDLSLPAVINPHLNHYYISDSTLVQELSKQTLPQDHLLSLADIKIDKEKRLVSPIGFESDVETP